MVFVVEMVKIAFFGEGNFRASRVNLGAPQAHDSVKHSFRWSSRLELSSPPFVLALRCGIGCVAVLGRRTDHMKSGSSQVNPWSGAQFENAGTARKHRLAGYHQSRLHVPIPNNYIANYERELPDKNTAGHRPRWQ